MPRYIAVCWWTALVAMSIGLSSCVQGGVRAPTREFSGVWLYEHEGSTFVEGATEIPTHRPRYEDTDWLEPDQRLSEMLEEDWGEVDHLECHRVLPMRVTFAGYRVHHLIGGTGHFGLWRSLVVAENTTSVERLGPVFCFE